MTRLALCARWRLYNAGMHTEKTRGHRWVLTTFEDTRAAASEVAAIAQRGLSILTPDLEPGLYDHEKFLGIVKRLVLAKRCARVRVLISEPTRTVRNGNRLVGLGRRLDTYIEFRNLHDDIADTHEPAVARRYLTLFEEIWAASETSRELRQLRV